MDYQNILNSIRKKNELFRKYKKTHSKFWCYRYKYYRNTINTLITKCKRNHLKKLFQEIVQKKVWSKISAMLQNIRKHFEEIFLSMMRKLSQTKKQWQVNLTIVLLMLL